MTANVGHFANEVGRLCIVCLCKKKKNNKKCAGTESNSLMITDTFITQCLTLKSYQRLKQCLQNRHAARDFRLLSLIVPDKVVSSSWDTHTKGCYYHRLYSVGLVLP